MRVRPFKPIFKLLLITSIFAIVSVGCYYPKVKVNKVERQQIIFPHKLTLLFSNQMGQIDTVSVFTTKRRGFEPNFDFWWYRKISKTDTISSKRNFGKTFFISSNYSKNKSKESSIGLFLRINYRKSEHDEAIILSIDEFKESYVLNNKVDDTLIFNKNAADSTLCQNKCVKKLIYSRKKGIIQLEQGDGAIWKLQ